MATTTAWKHEKLARLLFAWGLILVISDLPEIIFHPLKVGTPDWLDWAKLGIVAALLLVGVVTKTLRPLWRFALVFLLFQLALIISSAWGSAEAWRNLVIGSTPTFTTVYAESFIRDIFITGTVLLTLGLLFRSRRKFFLVKGELDAPIEPVRWLGIGPGESWRTFGWIFAAAAGLGVVITVVVGTRISLNMLWGVLPLLPVILLFAAINAFNEEIYYRTTILSTLPEYLGKNHALLINAAFFGLAHFFGGSPPGIFGFLLIGFLGWLMGKSILETKGLLWAWVIHFVPDIFTFASYTFSWM